MQYTFCTLFDSGYLDRGITLYESMENTMDDFHLYIYAFDKKAYQVLTELQLKHAEIINYEEIETKEMKELRKTRTRAEYCWTCTSVVIDYTLTHFPVDNCTYLDADLYFFANPQILVDDVLNNHKSVSIIRHAFPNTRQYRFIEKKNGKYCVQFNTFLNDESGKKVLHWWRDRCVENCSSIGKDGNFGDQKYQDDWLTRFDCVYELANDGAGVAPWNVSRYRLVRKDNDIIMIQDKKSKKSMPLIFFHFHSLRDVDADHMNIRVYQRQGKHDKDLVEFLYKVYIGRLLHNREKLKNQFGIQYPYRVDTSKDVFVKDVNNEEYLSFMDWYYIYKDEIRRRLVEKKDIKEIKTWLKKD
ncbi:MAG: hypothetical protein PHX08_02270 [Lachnospiraceae bacterium]|nr:hypothetical protein [Lachnospiraceae bacterium]